MVQCYYYLLSNLLTIGQTLVIRRMVDDSKIQAIMQANAAPEVEWPEVEVPAALRWLMRQQEAMQRAKAIRRRNVKAPRDNPE